jgi:hypothetical protein
MLFLKPYTPINISNDLIQYDYQGIYRRLDEFIRRKVFYRQARTLDPFLLSEKLDFNYKRKNLQNLTPSMITLINTYYCRGDCKSGCPRNPRTPHGLTHWQ